MLNRRERNGRPPETGIKVDGTEQDYSVALVGSNPTAYMSHNIHTYGERDEKDPNLGSSYLNDACVKC